MTTLVTKLTIATMGSSTALHLQGFAIVLLIAILTERELLRVGNPERSQTDVRAVNVVAVPLLIMYVLVIVSRLASFL